MRKNSVLFVILSAFTILIWFSFASSQKKNLNFKQSQDIAVINQNINKVKNLSLHDVATDNNNCDYDEEHITIKTEQYKVILTNKGAGILSWSVKEKNGKWVDLVIQESAPVMSNFPELTYKIITKSNKKIIFEHNFPEGWKITKTYNFSDFYMHNLNISVEKIKKITTLPHIKLEWGPGLGTDSKELKENISLTRVLAYSDVKPNKLKKLKNISEIASIYKWSAIDNRYFLVAFIPKKPIDFDEIVSSKLDKKHPYSIILTAKILRNISKKNYSVDFYVGPKGYTYLKTYKLGLEKTVDFGFFGILGKTAFTILTFLHKITYNYGWAIIILTIIIQILVFPLTLKSFKSIATMKRVQPIIKDIQTKYKNNPQRLQVEMLNVYKTQKVNPLSGCLPMLLQLPIFWAFFTMLRNAYELRNENWILWIKDLSAPDKFIDIKLFPLNLLPLIMGVGMFFQQKMNMTIPDPIQKKMMYIMPITFTFMFWSFPSGLVLYWLTNSIISMVEQYFVLKKMKK
ncbi:MAG: membrane protein insertase YidC [Endomicrobium sp.]|jgi:YidC/Oxa1 family membrane protein insertase|nr:membrane protein insertase YidC [Endomicrobium sp.]